MSSWHEYRKVGPKVRIKRFEPSMADKVVKGDTKDIYYIKTREGYRLVDEGMYVADKGRGYKHPMSAEVYRSLYVPAENLDGVSLENSSAASC